MLINDYVTASAGGAAGIAPLFWWQGWSRHWRLASVFPLVCFDCADAGVFVVARREPDGTRTPLMVGAADNVADSLYSDHGAALMDAIKKGANEVHVHLVPDGGYQREGAMADIARAWDLSPAGVTGRCFA